MRKSFDPVQSGIFILAIGVIAYLSYLLITEDDPVEKMNQSREPASAVIGNGMVIWPE